LLDGLKYTMLCCAVDGKIVEERRGFGLSVLSWIFLGSGVAGMLWPYTPR
jgi:hypothetical protein